MTNSTAAYFSNSFQPAWMTAPGVANVTRQSENRAQQDPSRQMHGTESIQPKSVTAQSVAMGMGSLPSPAPSAESLRGTPEVFQSNQFAAEDATRRPSTQAIPRMPLQPGVSQAQPQQQLSRPVSQASTQPAGPPASFIPVQIPAMPQQSFQSQAYNPSQASMQPQAYHLNQANCVNQQLHTLAPIPSALYYHDAIYIAHGYFNSKLSNEGRLETGLDLQRHLLTTALTPAQNPDATYLLVLQLVCVFLVDSSALPLPFKAIPDLKASLNSLAIIISNGRGLAPDFCKTFAMFPRHISQITLLPQEVLGNVQSLLTSFGARFPKACNDVHSRGYPLLPDEIALLFQIYSISLQKLVHDHLITKVFRVRPESDDMGTLRKAFSTWQAAFFQQRLRAIHITSETLDTLKMQFAYQTNGLCLKALQRYASSHPTGARGSGMQQSTFDQQPGHVRNVSQPSRPSSTTNFPPPVQGTQPPFRTSTAPALPGKLLYKAVNQTASQAMPSIYGFLDLHLCDLPMKVHQDSKHAGPFYQVAAKSPMTQESITTTEPLRELTFEMSEEDISAFPLVQQSSNAHPKEWLVKETTQILRFRCVTDESEDEKNDTRGMTTHWPHNVYFSLNGHHLEPRRKAQWHRDLPIDLTSFAKAGSNTLRVFINKLQTEDPKSYTLIVDRVALKTPAEILEDVYARVRTASEFIDALNGTQSAKTNRADGTGAELADASMVGMADDDDLLILDTTTTIPILDPISSGRLCAKPVRSTSCQHRQAFDLEIFLQSRPKRAGDDVYAFDWSCPICKNYAGPETLQVEEFLVQVASELGRLGKADARAIVVGKDGKWVPAEEKLGSGGKDARGSGGGRLKRQASDDSVLGHEIINID
jgi:hypothetical protein